MSCLWEKERECEGKQSQGENLDDVYTRSIVSSFCMAYVGDIKI